MIITVNYRVITRKLTVITRNNNWNENYGESAKMEKFMGKIIFVTPKSHKYGKYLNLRLLR